MKKIIIIDHEPLSIRRRQIFYIDELRAAGFELEFWDCSQYFHPGLRLIDTLDEPYVQQFSTLSQIERALEHTDIKQTIFIVESFENWHTRHFFRLLTQKGCLTVRQEMYATANLPSTRRTINQTATLLIEKLTTHPLVFLQSLLFRIYKHLRPFRFDFYICSGDRAGTTLHINHPDWEIAQDLKNAEPLIEGRYAVFIDEFFPLHPDSLFFEGRKAGDAATYQRLMNDFFEQMEKEHNLQVVIAAHPKAEYADTTFRGRKIIKYHSAALIRDAAAVFMHSSATISYVMIYDKPLALIVTNDYVRSQYTNMLRVSKMTGLPIYNIEKNSTAECHIIESHIRQSYLYSYLTSKGIEDTKNADILIKAFTLL